MERSADVLAAGLLEMADPSLSNKYFLRQSWMDESDGSTDSVLKHKPLWSSYNLKHDKKKRKNAKKLGDLQPTFGTRVVPVCVHHYLLPRFMFNLQLYNQSIFAVVFFFSVKTLHMFIYIYLLVYFTSK